MNPNIQQLRSKYGIPETGFGPITSPLQQQSNQARGAELQSLFEKNRISTARGGTDTSFSQLPGNILPSVGHAVADFLGAVGGLSPVKIQDGKPQLQAPPTIKAVGEGLFGAGEAGARKISELTGHDTSNHPKDETEQTFDAIAQFVKDRYGSLDAAKQTAINDPAGVLMDLATILSAGAGAASKIGTLSKAADLEKLSLSELTQAVKAQTPGLQHGIAADIAESAKAQTKIPIGQFIKDAISKIPEGSLQTGLDGVEQAPIVETTSKVAPLLSKASEAIDPLRRVGKTTQAVVEGVGNLAAKGLGLTTSRGSEVIKTAFKSRNPEFTQAMRTEGEKAKIVDTFHSALSDIKDQRGSEYQSKLAEISKQGNSFDISPIVKDVDKQLPKFGVTQGKEGLDFSRSTITSPSDQSKVLQAVQDVKEWGSKAGDRTATGLDTLKRRLGDYITEGSQARALIKSLQGQVDTILKKQVPGYQEMVSGYAKASDLIQQIEQTFSLGGKAKTETAITKMLGALQEDKELRTALVKRMEEASGHNITEAIAGAALNDWLPQSFVGRTMAVGGTAGGILSAKFIIGVASALATLSPRLVGEVVHGLGIGANKVKDVVKMIDSVRKKVPGIGNMSPTELEQTIYQAGQMKNQNDKFTE